MPVPCTELRISGEIGTASSGEDGMCNMPTRYPAPWATVASPAIRRQQSALPAISPANTISSEATRDFPVMRVLSFRAAGIAGARQVERYFLLLLNDRRGSLC